MAARDAERGLDLRPLEARFRTLVLLACGLYAVVEALYVLRLPLVMDEFQVAGHVHRLLEGIPYRDFSPYKTVLGYYLELPALAAGSGPWLPLVLVKAEIALLTAASLGASAFALARHFRPAAVLLGLGLLVVMSTFLERSAALRVDGLTALAGLGSLCLLLERRAGMAGVAAGLAFLISQKGVYYGVAGLAGTLAAGLLADPARRSVREPLRFALGAALPLLLYGLVFSLLASPAALWGRSVSGAAEVALEEGYRIHHFWAQTILRNPYFYGVALLGLGALYHRRRDAERGDTPWRLVAYGGVLLGLALWHRQPWPYFFVLVIPTLYVLAVAFFDLELGGARGGAQRLGAGALALYLAAGLAFPASRIATAAARSNEYQRVTVERAAALLEPGERYLAGVDLLREREQVGGGLGWLDARGRERLRRLEAEEARALLRRLERDPPKLVVESYRLRDTPEWLRGYLERRYAPYWGPLRLYAPAVAAGERRVTLRFGGRYRVEAPEGARPVVDGRARAPGETLSLSAGSHRTSSREPFRLRLAPPEGDALEASAEPRPLFPEVYRY